MTFKDLPIGATFHKPHSTYVYRKVKMIRVPGHCEYCPDGYGYNAVKADELDFAIHVCQHEAVVETEQ